MKSSRLFALALVAAAFTATAAAAAPETLKLDVAHTNVGFVVRHFFSKVPGRFSDFNGTLQYDAKNVTASTVEVTIQATSIDTRNDRRDNHLRSEDFFEVEKYPTLTFKSTKVVSSKPELAAGDKFQLIGDLTIKGITKPVTLDATFLGSGQVGIGGNSMGTVAGFEASGTINRKDFNILWNRTLDQGGTMLGDDVTLTLGVEAKTPMGPPTGAKPAAPAQTADKK